MAEYRACFEQFATTTRGLSDLVFQWAFLNGVREEIRTDLKILKPGDLQETMALAQEIDERNEMLERH